jgi:hypothetical protein
MFAVLTAAAPARVEAAAEAPTDIVWPTYDEIERNGDLVLDCDRLATEIGHVSSDIHLLNTAKVRVEDILHTAFDLERYSGTNSGGHFIRPSEVKGKESYAAAREQIVFSLHFASARHDFLVKLHPYCKPTAPSR